jgi:hypothetical protein
MTKQKIDEIRNKFELYIERSGYSTKKWLFAKSFTNNEFWYLDSDVEFLWQVFQSGFNFAKGEK